MNVASLVKSPRADAPVPSLLRLLQVQAHVLAQGLVSTLEERLVDLRGLVRGTRQGAGRT